MKHLLVVALLFAGAAHANKAKQYPLEARYGFDASMVRTLQTLQRHQEAVSQVTDKAIKAQAHAMGFKVVKIFKAKGEVLSGLQAYVAVRDKDLVVAFRGTQVKDSKWRMIMNVKTDAKGLIKKKIGWKGPFKGIKVHRGFLNDYEKFGDKIWAAVKEHKGKRIWVTGFSLGGALAQLCAIDMKRRSKSKVWGAFMGSPRVGGTDFKEIFHKELPNSVRVALAWDIIPKVPGLVNSRYSHTSPLFQLYPTGVQVPPKQINTDLAKGNMRFHKRCGYKDALAVLAESCGKKCKVDPKAAAKAERKAKRSIKRPLMDADRPFVCPKGYKMSLGKKGKAAVCKKGKVTLSPHSCEKKWSLEGVKKGKAVCTRKLRKDRYPSCGG